MNESQPESAPPNPHHLEQQRRSNREALRELGLSPYGDRADGILSSAEARARFDPAASDGFDKHGRQPGFADRRPAVRVAGRVMLLRDGGKRGWLKLRDRAGDIQVAVSQRDVSDRDFRAVKLLDLGDIVVADGRVMKTRTGEVTVWAGSLLPASKCLLPPPEKHAGLHDVELRYRRRYVDLWVNPETMRVFELRSAIVAHMRSFLTGRGYIEVETPMLQSLAGGAAARPFVTKMNALNLNLYLRIAPELYLKRLLAGGMEKVFEINRNFRNEGLDKQHNPEFTMLEVYHAFGDVETVMEMTESLVRACAGLVVGGGTTGDFVLPFGELNINYSKPFVRVTYSALFEKAFGFPVHDTARARAELKQRHPGLTREDPGAIDRMDDVLVVNHLFEDKAHGGEAQLDPATPTFITDYPAALSPLTRPKRDNPLLADRADLFIGGMEIAPHYTELNDPDVQEARFREQLHGLSADDDAGESTYRTMDEDFLRALKAGMPPAGGMGLGVDRLAMLLTNQRTIRDIVLFPLMRPE